MYSQKFSRVAHLEHIYGWLKARNAFVPEPSDMPEHGFVAYDEGQPVAAGFLRRVEGNYALVDSLVTNPDAPGVVRNQAIDMVVKHLLFKAKRLGLKHLIAFSVDTNTLMRSERHGFVRIPHAVIIADLTSGHEVR